MKPWIVVVHGPTESRTYTVRAQSMRYAEGLAWREYQKETKTRSKRNITFTIEMKDN